MFSREGCEDANSCFADLEQENTSEIYNLAMKNYFHYNLKIPKMAGFTRRLKTRYVHLENILIPRHFTQSIMLSVAISVTSVIFVDNINSEVYQCDVVCYHKLKKFAMISHCSNHTLLSKN